MKTVNELIDRVKLNAGIKSDYKLAQTLNLTQHTIANYRHGRSRPDDLVLSKMAELGGIPAAQIELLAVTLQAERANTDEARALWRRIAARLQDGAVHSTVLAVCLVAMLSAVPIEASAASPIELISPDRLYIMYSLLRAIFGRVRDKLPHVNARSLRQMPSNEFRVTCDVSCPAAIAPARCIA